MPNGISILLPETEILPSDPDITKGVRHLHGGLGPVDQTDVSGVSTDRTEVSKPGRHVKRLVRADNQDRKSYPRRNGRHGQS